MVIVYMFAGIIGAVISAALFWPFGLVIALAVAPFGGSLLAAAGAVFLAFRSLHRTPAHAPRRAEPHQPVDEVVVSSGRWVKGHSEDDQSWHGAVLDENREKGRVSGTISGRGQDKK